MSAWVGYCQEGLAIKENDVVFRDVREKSFKIYGLCDPEKNFRRIPSEVAAQANGGVGNHCKSPSGGRVRFVTDSPYIAIRVKHAPYEGGAPHISKVAAVGFDIYVEENGKQSYQTSFYPPVDTEDGYEGIRYFRTEGLHEVTLYMPYKREIFELEIGLKEGSKLLEHRPYTIEKPVVFYGSSITHGLSASRAGNSYEGFISRKLDCNYINLGLSGSAKGETCIAEYIAGLDMSAFVLDYDHNAPTVEHLIATHEPFYRKIREKNPELPIVIVTMPDAPLDEKNQERREVILKTYMNARAGGDKNIYFIDGYSLFPPDCRKDCTVDGCHPNDLGFYFMAERIGDVLKSVLKK